MKMNTKLKICSFKSDKTQNCTQSRAVENYLTSHLEKLQLLKMLLMMNSFKGLTPSLSKTKKEELKAHIHCIKRL